MNKFYNTFDEISSNFRYFFTENSIISSKTCLNILPEIITAMVSSTSCITKKISNNCKGVKFDSIQPESIDKRIRRFFNNKNYKPYSIYDKTIKKVIDKYYCRHKDNRIHICFDHMFKKDEFVTFMITLRLGKKSIPLWFRCFDGGHSSKEAFQEQTLCEGIKYISDLFKDKKDYKLIFLADRWFNSPSLLDCIDKLGHTYVIRARKSHYIYYYDEKEKHKIRTTIDKLSHYVHKATYYENIEYTEKKIKTNIVFSPKKSVTISNKTEDGEVSEPWIIFTNGDVKRAIKDYGYRFGAIEFLFKDQKSNGFNLEKSSTKNLQAYSMMYTCVCISILFLSCISTYYTRYKRSIYKDIKIKYYSIVKGKHKRKISILQVGIILFQRAFNSTKYIKIPFNFVLIDV